MKNTQEKLVVGKIGSTYGVQGWLKVQSYTELGEDILRYSPWLLVDKNNKIKVFEVEDARTHGKNLITKLKGINNPEQARSLTGCKIMITRSQLPTLKGGEYYWSDLIGLTVINKDNQVLGKIIYLMPAGPHDVIVVRGEREHAIPYLPDKVIMKIDLEKKEMHVDWEPI